MGEMPSSIKVLRCCQGLEFWVWGLGYLNYVAMMGVDIYIYTYK